MIIKCLLCLLDVRPREELQEFQGEREDQAEMSPRRSQATSEESRLVKSIAGLESERKVTRRHIHRVEGDVKPANDRAYENKVRTSGCQTGYDRDYENKVRKSRCQTGYDRDYENKVCKSGCQTG